MPHHRPMEDRIMQNIVVNPTTACWLYTGSSDGKGYATIWVGLKNNGDRRRESVHRTSYQLFKGSIPKGLELDHLCRNPACVNPSHLEPVTHTENLQRGLNSLKNVELRKAHGKIKTHCGNGHPKTEENIRKYGVR